MIYMKSQTIVNKINEGFEQHYKPFSTFKNSGEIWDECINTVNNPELMNHIIFCNDVLGIPPVKTFLAANTTLTGSFSDIEKKSIGAFWGFVFKFVFNYKSQKDGVPVNIKSVKTATYYYDIDQPTKVISQVIVDI